MFTLNSKKKSNILFCFLKSVRKGITLTSCFKTKMGDADYKCVTPYNKSTATLKERVDSCKQGSVIAKRGFEDVPKTRQECVNNCHNESEYRKREKNSVPSDVPPDRSYYSRDRNSQRPRAPPPSSSYRQPDFQRITDMCIAKGCKLNSLGQSGKKIDPLTGKALALEVYVTKSGYCYNTGGGDPLSFASKTFEAHRQNPSSEIIDPMTNVPTRVAMLRPKRDYTRGGFLNDCRKSKIVKNPDATSASDFLMYKM